MGFLSSLFGFGGDRPKTQQVVQATKLPEEIAPFAKEVLEEAKELYTTRMGEGYVPYTGETIAPFTSEQEQAMEGIAGLVGTTRPLQEEALETFRAGLATDFTPEVAQTYMSPYQRSVTDIEKREAQRDFESRIMPAFEKQAVGAGGMSGMGSRAGVQAAQLGKTQMERLGDIEAKGLQAAYQDAQRLFEAEQARKRTLAADVAGMGPAMFASGLTEQGALQTVGEQKQSLGQEALDEAYFRFKEKQAFPQEQLAGYSGFVYGNPLMQERTRTTTGPAPQPPGLGSQLMGLGMTAAKLYGMGGGAGFGGPGWSWGNLGRGVGQMVGTYKGQSGGGISSLPVVRRQNSGSTDPYDIMRSRIEDRYKKIYPSQDDVRTTGEKNIKAVQEILRRGIKEQQDLIPHGGRAYKRGMEAAFQRHEPGYDEPGLMQILRPTSAFITGGEEDAAARQEALAKIAAAQAEGELEIAGQEGTLSEKLAEVGLKREEAISDAVTAEATARANLGLAAKRQSEIDKGVVIPAGQYGQVRGAFDSMVRTGLFAGQELPGGQYKIDLINIGGRMQPLTEEHRIEINKIISDAFNKLESQGGTVASATQLMKERFEGVGAPSLPFIADPDDPGVQIPDKNKMVVGKIYRMAHPATGIKGLFRYTSDEKLEEVGT
jgi:hypothetical protein